MPSNRADWVSPRAPTPLTYDTVGTVVSYSYVVKNTGNVTLGGPFTVNDDKLGAVACPAGNLAPNATVTCSASYAVTQADLDAGSITNNATATDGTLTSNESQATVTAVQTPGVGDRQGGAGDELRQGGRPAALQLPGDQRRQRDAARRHHGDGRQGGGDAARRCRPLAWRPTPRSPARPPTS